MCSKFLWALWLGLLIGLCGACGDDEPTAATQIVVSVTSDMEPGTELTRIMMTLSNREGDDVVAMQEFAVVAADPADGQYTLPLTFSIGKGEEDSFLLVVTGYGPSRAGSVEETLVEHKTIATFQDGSALLLKVFLADICRGEFCGGDDAMVCYAAETSDVEQGDCGEIPELGPDELERIDVSDPPDFSLWPPGVGPDGGQPRDAGHDAAGFDAGCGSDSCCSDRDCDDLKYCTENVCDVASGECSNPPYVCPDDGNDCTLPVTCDEEANACPAAEFDETSLTSEDHCGASATSACVPCMDDATRTATCGAGSCSYVCFSGLHDVDGDLSNGCECTFMSAVDDEDDAALDTNCDGADGEVDGTRFVYVTPTGAGAGDGSSPADAATLVMAFTYAGTTTRDRLLLAAGDYIISSQLVASDGLVMFGGYAPDFRSRVGATNVLATSPSALLILNAVVGVTIDSVNFTTASQTTPAGTYTHTIDVTGSMNVELSRLTVTAGSGAAGAPGTPGVVGTNTVTLGGAGSNAPSTTTGGAGGAQGAGGNGGTGGAIAGGAAQTGVQGSNGTMIGAGSCGYGSLGGAGEDITCFVGNFLYGGNPGTAGNPGCPGLIGSQGAGGNGTGFVAADGSWTPSLALTGGPGNLGGSGGGGGGGGGITCSAVSSGGGGGEGGPGGGGGGPGGPGGPGGASIGILVHNSSISATSLTIATAMGGTGGAGGSGGMGGTGGDGGTGGSGLLSGSNPTMQGGTGGKGGVGGTGGRGGCGGGGAGGPSVGIFGSGSTVLVGTPTYQTGMPGQGGVACAAGGGNPGQMGLVYDKFGF